MSKTLIWAILATISLYCNADNLRYHWDFNKAKQLKNGSWYSVNLNKKTGFWRAKFFSWTEKGGWNKSGALECRSTDAKPRWSLFKNLNWPEATIEFKIKLNKLPQKTVGLFGYGKNSWKNRSFNVYLQRTRDGLSLKTVIFPRDMSVKGMKKLKAFSLTGPAYDFKSNVWYTIRITTQSGGDMNMYINGMPYAKDTNALSFSDLKGKPAKWYPLMILGSNIYDPAKAYYFDGLFDDLKLWDKVVKPDVLADVATSEISTVDPNLLVKKLKKKVLIDGELTDPCWENAEWTSKFIVPTYENPKIPGHFLEPDSKFVKNAAQVAMLYDDKFLYIAAKCPVPEGLKTSCKVKRNDDTSIWKDDNVEFFLMPWGSKDYYQLLINALGTYADIKCSPARLYKNWNSEIKVKVVSNKKGYFIELALPFRSLGFSQQPKSGSMWLANFIRGGITSGEARRSSWAPVGTSNHDINTFAKLVFSSRGDYFRNLLNQKQTLVNKILAADVSKKAKKQRAKTETETRKILEKTYAAVQKSADNPGIWDSLNNAFNLLDNNILSLSLAGRNTLLWGGVAARPDSPVPQAVKILKKIEVFAPCGARILKSFTVTNLAAKPYMGRFKISKDSKNNFSVNRKAPDPVARELGKRIKFKNTIYTESRAGRLSPQALGELQMGCVLQIPAKNNMPVWLEIDTHGMKPGKYKAVLNLFPSYSGFQNENIELELDVCDVDLSKIKPGWVWTYYDNQSARYPWIMKSLAKYGVNVLYAIPSRINIFPKLDKNGNIIKLDFSNLDNMIDNAIEAGIPKDELKILLWLAFDKGLGGSSLPYNRKGQARFLSPKWKKGFKSWLKSIVKHLRNKGIGYDRFVLYSEDEAHGDPHNPETSAYIEVQTARFIKSVDSNIKLMSNAGIKDSNFKYLPEQLKYFDFFMPHSPRLDKKKLAFIKSSGKRLWQYDCTRHKHASPALYRNLYWINIANKFESMAAFWEYQCHAGGDGLNSYDSYRGRGKSYTDYGTIIFDMTTEKWMPSLRQEAWYQGLLDYKVVMLYRKLMNKLKKQKKNISKYQKAFNEIIKNTPGSSLKKMDESRNKMLKLILEMKKSK